jgi:hypothetical protein
VRTNRKPIKGAYGPSRLDRHSHAGRGHDSLHQQADSSRGHRTLDPGGPRRHRDLNRNRIAEIAVTHAKASGWPEGLAAAYLGKILRYDIGSRELEAIELFWKRCHELGLLRKLRPMNLYVKPVQQ